MDETEASAPSNRMFEAKVLLDKIEEHNRPLSYGIVAHPFERRERWRDWSVRNLAGMEIINRSRKSRPEAVAKWFEFLRRDLSRTLRTGEFVAYLNTPKSAWACSPGLVSNRETAWAFCKGRKGFTKSLRIVLPPEYPRDLISLNRRLALNTPSAILDLR